MHFIHAYQFLTLYKLIFTIKAGTYFRMTTLKTLLVFISLVMHLCDALDNQANHDDQAQMQNIQSSRNKIVWNEYKIYGSVFAIVLIIIGMLPLITSKICILIGYCKLDASQTQPSNVNKYVGKENRMKLDNLANNLTQAELKYGKYRENETQIKNTPPADDLAFLTETLWKAYEMYYVESNRQRKYESNHSNKKK